jgi:hypothetical protein
MCGRLSKPPTEEVMNVSFSKYSMVSAEEQCLIYGTNNHGTVVRAADVPQGKQAWRSIDRLDLGVRIPDVVNPTEAERLKREGKEKAWAAVDPTTQNAGLNALYQAAFKNEKVTSDNVYLENFTPPAGKHNLMGALMSEGARLGWIEKTSERQKSNRPTGRSRELTVWKSRIYRGN